MMKRTLLLTLLVTAALIAAAGSSPAQPRQGDLVGCELGFGAGGGLFYKTWPSGAVKTFGPKYTMGTVKVPHGNGYVYVSGGNTGDIYRVDRNGVTTVMTTVPTRSDGIGVDQDGSHMIACWSDYKLYRLYGTTCTAWRTLSTVYGRPNALCRNGNTGDWIVGMYGGGKVYLLRVDRLSKSYGVLASLTGVGVYGVDWIPQTGGYVVAYNPGSGGRVAFLSASGTVHYSLSSSRVFNSVTADQVGGRVFAGTTTGYVYEFKYGGGFVRSSLVRSGANISGLDIWDDQNLSIRMYGSGSSTYARAQLKFSESPSRSYYVALSSSSTGGIHLKSSGWVNLKPDGLFFLTLGGRLPYFTSGFAAVLSSSGSAYARWTMPYTVGRVYVCAVAVNPAKPGGIDVGNVEVVDNW